MAYVGDNFVMHMATLVKVRHACVEYARLLPVRSACHCLLLLLPEFMLRPPPLPD